MNNNDDWMIQEVPTHVEQKDKVFMGMTFLQIVVFIMVSGMAYVIYQNLPADLVGTIGRYVIAALFWVIGVGCILIEVGGRNVVAVLWDIISHGMLSTNNYSGALRSYLDDPAVSTETSDGGAPPTPAARLLAMFERKVAKDG